ncbi:UNVERIFIED_CONTAM: hypothetical protein GTU68_004537 [Idotea baltica]|nr:hypothetical protein [Idotea baltica]
MSEPIELDSEIEFYNRTTQSVETEKIFGGGVLRWAYETGLGRVLVEGLFKRAFFSGLYGWWAKWPSTKKTVLKFIADFDLDPADFQDEVASFECFNDFFIRKLKPEVRPIDPAPEAIVFPADGRHLGFQDLSQVDHIYAKGQSFSLTELFGDTDLAARFKNGSAVISRLCPVDYHRFHFPAAGKCGEPDLINGVLYSVNPIALRRNVGILAENKRVLTKLESETAGTILILEVGATNVGSIIQTSSPGSVGKGDEKGYFEFGGSMTITFFEPGRVELAADLIENTKAGREIYARMGDRVGVVHGQ